MNITATLSAHVTIGEQDRQHGLLVVEEGTDMLVKKIVLRVQPMTEGEEVRIEVSHEELRRAIAIFATP